MRLSFKGKNGIIGDCTVNLNIAKDNSGMLRTISKNLYIIYSVVLYDIFKLNIDTVNLLLYHSISSVISLSNLTHAQFNAFSGARVSKQDKIWHVNDPHYGKLTGSLTQTMWAWHFCRVM